MSNLDDIPTAEEALATIAGSAPLAFKDVALWPQVRAHIHKMMADRVHVTKVYAGREPATHQALAIAYLKEKGYDAVMDETGHLVITAKKASTT